MLITMSVMPDATSWRIRISRIRVVADRNQRLRDHRCQWRQPAAPPARQDDCGDVLLRASPRS